MTSFGIQLTHFMPPHMTAVDTWPHVQQAHAVLLRMSPPLHHAGKPTAATGAAGIKAGDTAAIRELVQKLCQVKGGVRAVMEGGGEGW